MANGCHPYPSYTALKLSLRSSVGIVMCLVILGTYARQLSPRVDKKNIRCYCVHIQGGRKVTSATVSGRVPASLKSKIDAIAETEKRSVSNIVEMALESLVKQYEEIHPQFKEDLMRGLAQLDAGEVVPYERG